MTRRKLTPGESQSTRGLVDLRWLFALTIAGLLLTTAVFGTVGLTAAAPAGQQVSQVEDEFVDFFGSPFSDPAADDGVTVTNETITNVSESYPHADPDPLPDLVDSQTDPGVSQTSENVSSLAIEAQIHERVNEIRRNRSLQPINFSRSLSTHARAHSEDMYDRDYFSHKNPDGETAADRIPNAFQHCAMVGENLHYRTWRTANATTIANAAVEGWMNSPGHRENILRDTWTVQGIGVYIGTTDWGIVVYSTQKFCVGR